MDGKQTNEQTDLVLATNPIESATTQVFNVPGFSIHQEMKYLVDAGLTGYETPAELEANDALRERLERIRRAAGPRMNLGDVANSTVPKMCLIAPPRQGGLVSTRTFIPHTVHEAIGVLGAISTATACLLPGSVAAGIAVLPSNPDQGYSVEHPMGEFTVRLELTVQNGALQVSKSGVIRTARLLSRGEVLVPLLMTSKG